MLRYISPAVPPSSPPLPPGTPSPAAPPRDVQSQQPTTVLTGRFGQPGHDAVILVCSRSPFPPCPNHHLRLLQVLANMRSPPPEVLASWPTPNYVNPETRGHALTIVELTALSISSICLGLRLYVRARIMRSVDWDDWLMLAGAVRRHNGRDGWASRDTRADSSRHV